jgi:hypothetical protein
VKIHRVKNLALTIVFLVVGRLQVEIQALNLSSRACRLRDNMGTIKEKSIIAILGGIFCKDTQIQRTET